MKPDFRLKTEFALILVLVALMVAVALSPVWRAVISRY